MTKTPIETLPFEVGKTYRTLGGAKVKVVAASDTKNYETVRCDDGATPDLGFRYNRSDSDRGRTTGTSFDFTDQRNLIPLDIDGKPLPVSRVCVEEDKEHSPHGLILLAPAPDVIAVPGIMADRPDLYYKVGWYLDGGFFYDDDKPGSRSPDGHNVRYRKANVAVLDRRDRTRDLLVGHPVQGDDDEDML